MDIVELFETNQDREALQEQLRELPQRLSLVLQANSDAPRELATKIADALFTNGFQEKARRIVLEAADGRDLGGLCRGAVVDIICDVMRRLGVHPVPMPPPSTNQLDLKL